MSHNLRFLRLPEVLHRSGHSRSSVYRHIAEKLLPPPVHLGAKTSAWPEHEVDAVNRARLAGADDATVRALVADLIAARKAAT